MLRPFWVTAYCPGVKRPAVRYIAGLFRETSQAFGAETALRFARAFGGSKILIARSSGRSAVGREMGADFERWLQKKYRAYELVEVPFGLASSYNRKTALVDDLILAGTPVAKIRRRLLVSERTVRRRKARLREVLGPDALPKVREKVSIPVRGSR